MNKIFCFRLHEWQIEIHTEVPRYIQTLRRYLPCYFNDSFRNRQTKTSKQRKICFKIFDRTEKEKRISSEFDQKSLSQLRQLGICSKVNSGTGTISIFVNTEKKISDNIIYHAGFLHPLFLNLLPYHATLMHASLVKKHNSGVLISGRSGVGKSTLSVVFLSHGFTYLSDEHPIIELSNGKIVGKSFKNRIGLPIQSTKNFPKLKNYFQWNSNVRKFYFDPWKKDETVHSRCLIDKIIFPKFRHHGIFRIRKLKPVELFDRLTRDDYFFMDNQDDFKNSLGQNHLEILMELTNGRKGFEVNYGPADIRKLPAVIENL